MEPKTDTEIRWEVSNRIGDRIIDILNEEIRAGTKPIALFSGLLLALIAVLWTASENDVSGISALTEQALTVLKAINKDIQPSPKDTHLNQGISTIQRM
jgi:hypothetical protein